MNRNTGLGISDTEAYQPEHARYSADAGRLAGDAS